MNQTAIHRAKVIVEEIVKFGLITDKADENRMHILLEE